MTKLLPLLVLLALLFTRSAFADYSISVGSSNGKSCDGAVGATYVVQTPQQALAAFQATYPRTCTVGGVVYYTTTAFGFALTSDTSISFSYTDTTASTGAVVTTAAVKTFTYVVPVVVPCPKGTVHSTGFYDVGSDLSVDHPPFSSCTPAGCVAEYNGHSISARAMVLGVYHYFARGSYLLSGVECTSGAPTPVSVGTTKPVETCAAGQSSITFNGVTRCLNSGSGSSVPSITPADSASAVAAAEAIRVQAVAEAIARAISDAIRAGLSPAEAAGAGAVASGTISGRDITGDDVIDAWCLTNSSSALCQASGGGSTPGPNWDGTPNGTTEVIFPSDYARTGEAMMAADMLGVKVDALKSGIDTIASAVSVTSTPDEVANLTAADMPNNGLDASFAGLRGWSLPVHSSVCPQPVIDLSDVGMGVHTLSSHCGLMADISVTLHAAMVAVFTVLALFLVLSA